MTDFAIPQSSPSLGLDQALRLAINHHQSGELQDAERYYRAVLNAVPEHADANHNLGVLAVQVNQPAAALPHFKAALEANPASEQFWTSYIDTMIRTGHADAARLIQSIGLLQDMVPAQVSARWGDVAMGHGIQDMLSTLAADRALKEFLPDFAVLQSRRANALLAEGKFSEAESSYRLVLQIDPKIAAVHCNLGNALMEQDRFSEAEVCNRRALEIEPDLLEAHNNLGNALWEQGRFSEAEASYRRALEINPSLAETHNNLSNALRELGQLAEAEASSRKALQINPEFPLAYVSLAGVRHELGDVDGAVQAFQKAFSIEKNGVGVDVGVWLAVLLYLQRNFEQVRNILIAAQAIMTTTEDKFKPGRIYYMYLGRLLTWHHQAATKDSETADLDTLYVLGDSHTLSTHGIVVRYGQGDMRCRAEWIPDCTQWYLGNGVANKYKRKFELVMAQLPRESVVMLSIGEIDCRPDGGILKAWKKAQEKSLDQMVRDTASGYLSYVADVAARFGHKLIIGGVPATNFRLHDRSAEEVEQFVGVIRSINKIMKELSAGAGIGFLDLYALTDQGDGIASGQWHIDDCHLLPDAIVEAFSNNFVPGAA